MIKEFPQTSPFYWEGEKKALGFMVGDLYGTRMPVTATLIVACEIGGQCKAK